MFKGVHMSGVGMFGVGWGGYVGVGTYPPSDMGPRIQWDTVGKRAVHIPLECFLVLKKGRIVVNFFVLFFSEN